MLIACKKVRHDPRPRAAVTFHSESEQKNTFVYQKDQTALQTIVSWINVTCSQSLLRWRFERAGPVRSYPGEGTSMQDYDLYDFDQRHVPIYESGVSLAAWRLKSLVVER